MIQKITSKRLELPPIYLVENEDDFKELPRGLPYIIGKKEELSFIKKLSSSHVRSYRFEKTNYQI